MPILAINKEIEIELTHECNWNCPYCAIHVHKQKNISHEEALSKVMSISDGSIVTLSGGEPGLISRNHIEQYINILKTKKCKLYLNTNGQFLFNYPDLVGNFEQIIYHCSENLDNKVYVFNEFDNIDYMIIVNDDNFPKLEKFMADNSDIKISIVEATYNKANDGPTLSKKNKYEIMTKFCNRMTKASIQRMIHEKEFDKMTFI